MGSRCSIDEIHVVGVPGEENTPAVLIGDAGLLAGGHGGVNVIPGIVRGQGTALARVLSHHGDPTRAVKRIGLAERILAAVAVVLRRPVLPEEGYAVGVSSGPSPVSLSVRTDATFGFAVPLSALWRIETLVDYRFQCAVGNDRRGDIFVGAGDRRRRFAPLVNGHSKRGVVLVRGAFWHHVGSPEEEVLVDR